MHVSQLQPSTPGRGAIDGGGSSGTGAAGQGSGVSSGVRGVSKYHQALQDKFGGDVDGSSEVAGSASIRQRRHDSGSGVGIVAEQEGCGHMQPLAPPLPDRDAALLARIPWGRSKARTCSICLEDFAEGDQVRNLT